MTFSSYHLYAEMISRIDHMIGQIAAVAFVALELIVLVKIYRPAWLKFAAWILIGGFYATLFALVSLGSPGP